MGESVSDKNKNEQSILNVYYVDIISPCRKKKGAKKNQLREFTQRTMSRGRVRLFNNTFSTRPRRWALYDEKCFPTVFDRYRSVELSERYKKNSTFVGK